MAGPSLSVWPYPFSSTEAPSCSYLACNAIQAASAFLPALPDIPGPLLPREPLHFLIHDTYFHVYMSNTPR